MEKSITQFLKESTKNLVSAGEKFIKNPTDIASYAMAIKENHVRKASRENNSCKGQEFAIS